MLTMTLRLKKRLLRLLSGTIALTAILLFVGNFTTSSSLPIMPTPDTRSADQGDGNSEREHQVLHFAELYAVRLQRPLFDPPPPPPPVVKVTPPPPLKVKLIGTIIDPANPQAIIEDERQSVSIRSIGQPVSDGDADAIIEKIEPNQITVVRGDHPTTLTLQ